MKDKLLISMAVLLYICGKIFWLLVFVAIFWGIVDEIKWIFSK